MNSKIKPVSRKKDIIIQEMAGETLVYDLLKDKAFCLNETSSFIWQLCDGTRSLRTIAEVLSRQLKTQVSEDVVWLAIDQFKKDGLLEDNNVVIQHSFGMSRREVIKKVGIASAVSLPLISVIVAPVAAQMGSCLPPNTPCAFGQPPNCCAACNAASMIPGSPGICG
jgi:hypothetical protein